MHPYIKKIRSKPEHVKKSILALALIVSMSLVSFIWIYNIQDRFSDDKKIAEKSREDVKPFTLLTNSISDTWENIGASVGNVSSIKNKLTETTIETSNQTDNQIQPEN